MLDQMMSQSTEDVRSEFRELEKNLAAGEEEVVHAYFRFLCFMWKNQSHLTEYLTPEFLRSHWLRLHRKLMTHRDSLNNDPEFIQCLIWLAEFNPRMYKDLVEKNIGNRLAVTYVMYSRTLVLEERIGDAIAVLEKGIELNALPLSYLEDTLRELRTSSGLQTKKEKYVVLSRNVAVSTVLDPHQRFSAEAQDFGPNICRSYDFRAVYPRCHAQEFQFEERRVRRWRRERKKTMRDNLLKAKHDEIENLRAIVNQLQEERMFPRTLNTGEKLQTQSGLETSKRFERSESVPLKGTRNNSQAESEVSKITCQPTQDAPAAMNENKAEMMTRDMGELFWKGTFHSTNPNRPMLAVFEESSAPHRIAILDENDHKMKTHLSPSLARKFADCADGNRAPETGRRRTASLGLEFNRCDENPPLPSKKGDENDENVVPSVHEKPVYLSEETNAILVALPGLEDVLQATPLDDVGDPVGRAPSTPPKSTNLKASKESQVSNLLGASSLARVSARGSSENENSLPTLSPIVPDPFNLALRNKVILGAKIPHEITAEKLPAIKKNCILEYSNGYRATIHKMIGRGGFAKVYFAERHLKEDDDFECDDAMTTCIVRKDHAAIKITNKISAGLWEIYILYTISGRLSRQSTDSPCIRKSIPEPHCAAHYVNGFLISLPYLPYGSLVDIVNKFNGEVPEIVTRYLIIELMTVVMRLHENGIIHADLKPDNVLFRKIPSIQMITELRSKTQCLCLIDFGRAIDLEAYSSPSTTFSYVVDDDIQKCVAMRERREWLFDFDWFGVANCAHSLLFGEYMDVEKMPSGDYSIKKRLPRYWDSEWWNMFFHGLLNMTASTSRPDHIDYQIKNIIELGMSSLNNKECLKKLSAKLPQLNSLLGIPRAGRIPKEGRNERHQSREGA